MLMLYSPGKEAVCFAALEHRQGHLHPLHFPHHHLLRSCHQSKQRRWCYSQTGKCLRCRCGRKLCRVQPGRLETARSVPFQACQSQPPCRYHAQTQCVYQAWAQGNTRDVRPVCDPALVILRDELWYRQGLASRDSETQELNIWIEIRHAGDSYMRNGLRRTDLYANSVFRSTSHAICILSQLSAMKLNSTAFSSGANV